MQAREGGFGDNANNAQTVGVGQTTQGNQFEDRRLAEAAAKSGSTWSWGGKGGKGGGGAEDGQNGGWFYGGKGGNGGGGYNNCKESGPGGGSMDTRTCRAGAGKGGDGGNCSIV